MANEATKIVSEPTTYLDFYNVMPLVEKNYFLGKTQNSDTDDPLPTYQDSKQLLPVPSWEGHEDAIRCYWFIWELAFKNLRKPTSRNGFVSDFIDTAFNGCIFMWDSAFILMFAKYAERAFNFQGTLDNFYGKQHADGFICREIRQSDGADQFHRHDLCSTGPNILAWSEWEYFNNVGDRERLEKIFVPLVAYHRWMREHRTWLNGSYFTCGLGSGMDNQPRPTSPYNAYTQHGHMSWVDACCQAALSANILHKMSVVLGCENEVQDMVEETERLKEYINEGMYNQELKFYVDTMRDGSQSSVKTIGAFWALIAEVVPSERLDEFVAHLENENEFKRPHRIPSLSYDHPLYNKEDGGYWKGGVWAPTNYMVLRGLSFNGYDDLAFEIGLNHLSNVVKIFNETGTVWENYSPEKLKPGYAKPDFVGWSGLGPVAVLFEYVFGLRAIVPSNTLVWRIKLLEAHGVERYPFGKDGILHLGCAARESEEEKPQVEITSSFHLKVVIKWKGGEEVLHCQPTLV